MTKDSDTDTIHERLTFLATWRYGLSEDIAEGIVERWRGPDGRISATDAIVEIRARGKKNPPQGRRLTAKDLHTIQVLLARKAEREGAEGGSSVAPDLVELLREFRLKF